LIELQKYFCSKRMNALLCKNVTPSLGFGTINASAWIAASLISPGAFSVLGWLSGLLLAAPKNRTTHRKKVLQFDIATSNVW
jgi:hypothetical protein